MRRFALACLVVGYALLTNATVQAASNNPSVATFLAKATALPGQGGDQGGGHGLKNPNAPTRELAEGTAPKGVSQRPPGGTAHVPGQPAPEQRLATLDKNGYIPEGKPVLLESDPAVQAMKQQLDILAAKCGEDQNQLADDEVRANSAKAQHGKRDTHLNTLAHVNGAVAAGQAGGCGGAFDAEGGQGLG